MAIWGTLGPLIDNGDFQTPESAFEPVAYNPNLANAGWYGRQERIFRNRGPYGRMPLSTNVVDQRGMPPPSDDVDHAASEKLWDEWRNAVQPSNALTQAAGVDDLSSLIDARNMANARERLASGLRWEQMQPSEFRTDRSASFFMPPGGGLRSQYDPWNYYDAVGLAPVSVVRSDEPREGPSLRELNPALMLEERAPLERAVFGSISPENYPEHWHVEEAADDAARRTVRSVRSPRTPGPITFGLTALGLTPEILARIAAGTLGGAYDKFTGR